MKTERKELETVDITCPHCQLYQVAFKKDIHKEKAQCVICGKFFIIDAIHRQKRN